MIIIREKQFENKIKKYLESVGVYRLGEPVQNTTKTRPVGCYFKVWGGGFQQAGIPDLICNINGKFVAVEVKGSGGTPSKLQEVKIKQINESKGIGLILYPDDFDKFKELVDSIISKRR